MYRLLVHRNVVKRHQHQAHPRSAGGKQHSIDNQLLEGACFQGVRYDSSKEGPNGHYYANSSTYIKMEQRLLQQGLLYQRLLTVLRTR